MPISEKQKPLTDAILATLKALPFDTVEQSYAAISTKTLMSGATDPNMSGLHERLTAIQTAGGGDLTKIRAALKAMKAAGLIFKLGNTRSTTYKAIPDDETVVSATIKDIQDANHAAADATDTGRLPRTRKTTKSSSPAPAVTPATAPGFGEKYPPGGPTIEKIAADGPMPAVDVPEGFVRVEKAAE